MEITKKVLPQDSGFKLQPVHSGESAINLSNDVLEVLYPGDFERELNTAITFTIYKEDFIKALCFIVNKLPLYKTSSKDAVQKDFSVDFFLKYMNNINDFFGSLTQKEYTCNLLLRKDGRNYLNQLKVGSFSIRDFLVGECSELVFGKSGDGSLYIRLLSLEATEDVSTLLISEKQHCTFAFKCLSYFSDKSIWSKIDQYVEDFGIGESVKLNGKTFKLTGLFKCASEDEINQLNTPRRRWYVDPFTIKNHSVYLSTEWYPDQPSTGNKKYQLTIPILGDMISECFGNEYEVRRNDETWELRKKNLKVTKKSLTSSQINDSEGIFDTSKVDSEPFSISSIIRYIDETGLLYDSTLIKRFAFSLMSKRFLILSGLAGSGKTQLALAFANALVETDNQMCVVSVGADWTNREPLLGFPNALQEGCYVAPECGALNLLIEANREENKHKPFFLILDEMNMSYVERYFADFLSAMESHKPIALWNGGENSEVPASINLPNNLFIIGTINVDETTYMFSPKVLDRANVIEFKISDNEMERFLTEMKDVDRDSINYKAAGMGSSFVALAQNKAVTENVDKIKETLNSFFVNLKSVNAEFGYRSATEIYRFISQSEKNDDTEKQLSLDDILDCAMVQKLLPKLHGSRKKLEPVLQALWKECFENVEQKETLSIAKENVKKAKYPLTADKIQRMYEAAYANGFTSFAEA